MFNSKVTNQQTVTEKEEKDRMCIKRESKDEGPENAPDGINVREL